MTIESRKPSIRSRGLGPACTRRIARRSDSSPSARSLPAGPARGRRRRPPGGPGAELDVGGQSISARSKPAAHLGQGVPEGVLERPGRLGLGDVQPLDGLGPRERATHRGPWWRRSAPAAGGPRRRRGPRRASGGGIFRTTSGPRSPWLRLAWGSGRPAAPGGPGRRTRPTRGSTSRSSPAPLRFSTVTVFTTPSRAILTVNNGRHPEYRAGGQWGMRRALLTVNKASRGGSTGSRTSGLGNRTGGGERCGYEFTRAVLDRRVDGHVRE